MAIIDIQISQTGLAGVTPQICYIATNDTEAAVLVVGYLNSVVAQGFIFTVPCICCVTTQVSAHAASDVGWFEVINTGKNWSLASIANPGDVILPTTPGNIAVYADTVGTLTQNASTAFNRGNIQCFDGIFISGEHDNDSPGGELVMYPEIHDTGNMDIFPTGNLGDYTIEITNAPFAQMTTLVIPNPANANARFLIAATATPFTDGHLLQANGTQGVIIDAGVPSSSITSLAQAKASVTKVFTLTFTQLATAGKVNIVTAASVTAQYVITNIQVLTSTGLSGGGGNRLLAVSDGTIVYNNAGITAALLGTPIFTLWGGTGNPIPVGTTQVSTAGANIYFQYTGGTTDYTAGSVQIAVTFAQVTA